MKVIIDTNVFLVPFNYKVDVITGIKNLVQNAELVTLDATLRELSQHKNKKAVKLALSIIARNDVKIESGVGNTDNAIIRYAEKNKAMVFTNDAAMMERCEKKGIKVLFVKKNKFVAIQGE